MASGGRDPITPGSRSAIVFPLASVGRNPSGVCIPPVFGPLINTDMQAAIGCAQLKKLLSFIQKRRNNFDTLYNYLKDVEQLILPQTTELAEPSWFGFYMTLREDVGFSRNDLVKHLEIKGIQTRNLFAGNITRHPCFDSLVENQDYRIPSTLLNTDRIMNDSFWIGLYPGMGKDQLTYMADRSMCDIAERVSA